jgi:hypothetical protein
MADYGGNGPKRAVSQLTRERQRGYFSSLRGHQGPGVAGTPTPVVSHGSGTRKPRWGLRRNQLGSKPAWKEDSEPVRRRRPTARAARIPSGTGWPKKRRLVAERRREPRGSAAPNRPDRAVAREGMVPRDGGTQPERALTWARWGARSERRRWHIEGEVGCRPRRKTPL